MPSSPRPSDQQSINKARAKMQSDSIKAQNRLKNDSEIRRSASPSGSNQSINSRARVAKSTATRSVAHQKPPTISSHSDYKPSKGSR